MEPILFISLILQKLGLPVPHDYVGHTFLAKLCEPYMTYTWLVMAFLFIVPKLTLGNLEMVPGGGQNFWEALLGMLDDFFVENMGRETADRFFPMLATFSLYIAVANLIGLIPGFMSPTASLNTTLAMTLIVWFVHHIVGLRTHGLKYYKHFMGPIKWLIPLMLPIELVSNAARMVSLSVRLFGNIMAKETLLAILFLLAGAFFAPLPIMILGVLVALVQTMVFVLLSVIYIAQAEDHAH